MKFRFQVEQGVVGFITSTIFEAFTVLAVIFLGLAADSYYRIVLPGRGTFDKMLWGIIFSRSVLVAMVFTVSYRLAKMTFWTIWGSIGARQDKNDEVKSRINMFMLDVFVTTAMILSLMPIRPTLQHTIIDGKIPYATTTFIKYGALPTATILGILGLPTMALIKRDNKLKLRKTAIVMMLMVLIAAYLMNK